MSSDPDEDKSPVRRVFWTFFHSTALFLMVLQVGELFTKFRRDHVTFSVTMSEEDVPFPAVSVCTTEIEDCFDSVQSLIEPHINEPSFMVVPELLSLEFDDSANVSDIDPFNRKLSRNSIKTLEDLDTFPCNQPSWKPLDHLQDCKFQNYSCLEKNGSYHSWEKSTEWVRGCQTLRISKKIKPNMRTTLTLTWQGHVDVPLTYYLHNPNDTLPLLFSSANQAVLYSEPGNINCHLMDVSKSVELHRRLEEATCQEEDGEEYDKTKCLETCIVKSLLKQKGSCVLPWMKVKQEGLDECSSLEEFVEMMQMSMNSSKKLAMHCDCPHRCNRYSYTSIESVRENDSNIYQQEIKFDMKEGIKVTEERWDYGMWQLIADTAGSIDIFYGFDILGFLYSVGTALAWLSVYMRWVTKEHGSSVKKTVITIAWLICGAMLGIQLTELYLMYARKEIQTNMKMNSADILSAPRVSLCVPRKKSLTELDIQDIMNNTEQYHKARESLASCTLNAKSCMKNEGKSHRWKRSNYAFMMCDTIIASSDAASANWNITFEFSHELNYSVSIYVHKHDHVPYFDVIPAPFQTYHPKNHSTYYTYSLREETIIEETCNAEYLRCLEDCVMLEIDSVSPCVLPWYESMSIKEVCLTRSEYGTAKDTTQAAIREGWVNKCACRRPCRSVEYELVSTVNRQEEQPVLVILLSKELSVQLLQEFAYSFSEFVSECGASIDFFIGMSVVDGFNSLFIFMLICINWLATKNQTDIENSIWVKIMKRTIKFFGWILFSYMIYTRVMKFMESPKETIVSEAPHLSQFIPAVTLCSESEQTINNLRRSIKECEIQGEPCRAPNGTYHQWTSLYDMGRACISLIVQNERDLPAQDINIELHLSSTPTVYVHDRRQTFTSLGSDASEQTAVTTELMYLFKLRIKGEKFQRDTGLRNDCVKQGNMDYNQCLKTCLLQDVDNADECLSPSAGEDRRRKPNECATINKLQEEYMIERRDEKDQCNCPQPCFKIKYNILEEERIQMKDQDGYCDIHIHSIPEDNVSIKEKKSYPMSEMWSDIGGLMGVFAGASLFTIYGFLEALLSKLLFCEFFKVRRAPHRAHTPMFRFPQMV